MYQLLKEEDGNLFYSPYSISLALAMTYAGARGNTETQMAQALHFDLPQDALHPAFNALDLDLLGRANGEKDSFELNIANSIWGQQDFAFEQAFLDTLAANYGAGLRLTDFANAPEPARQAINQWVSNQTKERIKDLIPDGAITPDTRLVLANAIYFNAKWVYPFSHEGTHDGTFNTLDGAQITVPLMNLDRPSPLAYVQGQGFQAVELPYVGEQMSMLVVVPDAGTFPTFEAAFSADQLATILAALQPQTVQLTLPKFQFESSFNLGEALTGLGMTDAFDPSAADFSGMDGEGDLFIGAVIHKAFVAVDEEGTEAAAATAVIMEMAGAATSGVILIVDRPFLFFIRDMQTGTLLFAGRVVAPETGG
jgi:serpin B